MLRLLRFLNSLLFDLPSIFSALIILIIMASMATVAFKTKHLTLSGAISAAVLGGLLLWTVKFEGLLLILVFYVGANVAGKFSRKRGGEDTIVKKGGARDFMQVLANGLFALLGALIWYVNPSVASLAMFGAAVAEAMSDTFASEIGRLSKVPPVSIRNFRPVPKGLSGGITVLGTLWGIGASVLIAIAWYFLIPGNFLEVKRPLAVASIIAVCGFAGCVADSVLGASVQAHYWDPDKGCMTEKDRRGDVKLELCQGIRWVDNDMVNLMSNAFSAIFAFGMCSSKFI